MASADLGIDDSSEFSIGSGSGSGLMIQLERLTHVGVFLPDAVTCTPTHLHSLDTEWGRRAISGYEIPTPNDI